MKSFFVQVPRLPFLTTLLLAFLVPAVSAKAEVLISRYNVSVNGIPAGEATLHTTYDAKRYEIKVSADVGTVLESTKIQGTAVGARAGAAITPERFQMVVSGGEEGTIDINFKGDTDGDTQINPRLRGVFDPLSALLATSLKPQTASGNPCNHVLPIFTGRARFDLNLHPKAGGGVTVKDDESDSPFIPKANAEPKKERTTIVACDADYAAMPGEPFQKIDLEIAFTKVAKPKFWLVERVSLPTNKGTVTIERAETSISGS
jgi:Protein of unknown function (DUF3108)